MYLDCSLACGSSRLFDNYLYDMFRWKIGKMSRGCEEGGEMVEGRGMDAEHCGTFLFFILQQPNDSN